MNFYIDTHAHYSDNAYDADREELLGSLAAENVGIVIDPAVDVASAEKAISIGKGRDGYYCAAGIHPHECGDADADDYMRLEELLKGARERKIVAVGETGLDYHYDFAPKEKQHDNFRRNIELALRYRLPLIVHDREAHKDTYDILLSEGGFETRVLFHCYSGSGVFSAELLKKGCYFSFGGAVTFKNARKFEEVVGSLPSDRILPETDSPYMSPEPRRGRRNDSTNLKYIYPRLALYMKLPPEKVFEVFCANTARFFEIDLDKRLAY